MKKRFLFLLLSLIFSLFFASCTGSDNPELLSQETLQMLNAPFIFFLFFYLGSLEGEGTLTKNQEEILFEVLSPDTVAGFSLTVTPEGVSAGLYGMSFPVPEEEGVSGAVEALKQLWKIGEGENWTKKEEGEATVYQGEDLSVVVLPDDSFSEIRFPKIGLTFFFTSFTRSSS